MSDVFIQTWRTETKRSAGVRGGHTTSVTSAQSTCRSADSAVLLPFSGVFLWCGRAAWCRRSTWPPGGRSPASWSPGRILEETSAASSDVSNALKLQETGNGSVLLTAVVGAPSWSPSGGFKGSLKISLYVYLKILLKPKHQLKVLKIENVRRKEFSAWWLEKLNLTKFNCLQIKNLSNFSWQINILFSST